MKNFITILFNALKPFIQKYGKYLWKIIWFFLSPVFNRLVKRLTDLISQKKNEKPAKEKPVVVPVEKYPVQPLARSVHSTPRRKKTKMSRKTRLNNTKK